ncbi:17333_t:CDS:1, partial [Cetraspora pellucida]
NNDVNLDESESNDIDFNKDLPQSLTLSQTSIQPLVNENSP